MIRYANVNGQRREPEKGLKGTCPGCGKGLNAKCGEIRIHHWAHESRKDCDLWWEQMTEWHLDWQNQFPQGWRENIITKKETEDYHQADIQTPDGIIIKFQHSNLSLVDIESRNNFYEKLIWVVNAKQFKHNIKLQDIPNPNSPLLNDFDFQVDLEGFASDPLFYKKVDYRQYGPAFTRSYSERDEIIKRAFAEQTTHQYKNFTWQHKRLAWLSSTAPVFLDYGEGILYWIRKREQESRPLYYMQLIPKEEFLAKYTKRPATE
ncbi:competence protein CoiA [Chitinophaga filiformis]|uniref:Competence protein CoiA-like family protein n=1 Tax=Chitinophaga filiformis TaxID=104663 RepID=A0A1G7MJS0_CHIFI|nr:competence protein CoiA family protein [Chitinophaga filiformis]SDF62138.1 Competence protein CoiA-like family protein [Chitinophaga filiformis]